MSISIVKSQVTKFLQSKQPEVMAIKGGWGVGKTYSWNRFLLEAKEANGIAFARYSYVSLFGMSSLNDFKYAIFEQVVSRDLIGSTASVETFRNNSVDLLNSMGRKTWGLIKDNSLTKGFSTAIQSISFMSLNETLICIDDIERKSNSLHLKDVLGLISILKEQKKCKVVLLINDGEEGLEDYIKYREKVVDCELLFSPSSEECVSIAYDVSDKDIDLLANFTKKLNIRNIRLLKKIERLVRLAKPYLQGLEPEVSHQIIHSLTLFSWCFYTSNDESPSLEYVTNLGYTAWGIGDDENQTDEAKKWKSLLIDYGYQLTDELDLVLADAVRTGYFVEADLNHEITKKNNVALSAKSENSFSDAWRIYHDNFDNNQTEVVTKLYESFMTNVKNISPTNLNGTVNLFRELGENAKASQLIDAYIDHRKEEIELFDLSANHFFSDAIDAEVVAKFNQLFEKAISPKSALQILENIAGKDGWNQSDELILANTTADQYYKIFKSLSGRHLSSYVHTCLQFGRFANSSEQQKRIASNATEALKRIGKESTVNMRRVKKYGIDVSAI